MTLSAGRRLRTEAAASDDPAQKIGRDRDGALPIRSPEVNPVQFVDGKRSVRKLVSHPQLVDEHLPERSNGCELALFEKHEPALHVCLCTGQAVARKFSTGYVGHRRANREPTCAATKSASIV